MNDMEKNSKERIVCTWCDKDALKDTDPPACLAHAHSKKASAEPATLKELEALDCPRTDGPCKHCRL